MVILIVFKYVCLQVTRGTKGTEDPRREDTKENQGYRVYQVNV